MMKPIDLGPGGAFGRPTPAQGAQPAVQSSQPARPQQARVVPLATKDYLRFLHPNAQLVAGFDFEEIFRSPELMGVLFSPGDGQDMTSQIVAALKEMDHLWLSFAPPSDGVLLMTGKFEQGATAGLFYAQGIRPVFLGGPHAMMIGSEPSIEGALARLAKPVVTGGWAARWARELSKDHETWIVNQLAPGAHQGAAALQGIRQFALGFRLSGEAGIDGEVVADSEASAQQIAAWVAQMKAAIREKTGIGALDALTIQLHAAVLC